MLSLQELTLFTVVLLVPFVMVWRNYMRHRESTFFQMLLGYVSCYFMKNCYALFDRAINGVENNSSGVDGLAVIAIILFLAAVISCGKEYPEEAKYGRKPFLAVLCAASIAVLLECATGIWGNRFLFIICYLCSFLCVFAAVVMAMPFHRRGTALNLDGEKNGMESNGRK